MNDLLDRLASLPPEQVATYAAGLGAAGYSAWRLCHALCRGSMRLVRWVAAPKPVSPLCQAILDVMGQTADFEAHAPDTVRAGPIAVTTTGCFTEGSWNVRTIMADREQVQHLLSERECARVGRAALAIHRIARERDNHRRASTLVARLNRPS